MKHVNTVSERYVHSVLINLGSPGSTYHSCSTGEYKGDYASDLISLCSEIREKHHYFGECSSLRGVKLKQKDFKNLCTVIQNCLQFSLENFHYSRQIVVHCC
jgi:hypothetical protein